MKLENLIQTIFDQSFEASLLIDSKGFVVIEPSPQTRVKLPSAKVERHFLEVLQLEESKKQSALDWFKLVLSNKLPFNDIVELGPAETTVNGWRCSLSYKLLDQDPFALWIGLNSQRPNADQETEIARARMVLYRYHNPSMFFRCLETCIDMARSLKNNFKESSVALRDVHTLKGFLATCSIHSIYEVVSSIDQELKSYSQPWSAEKISALGERLLVAHRDFLSTNEGLLKILGSSDGRIISAAVIESFRASLEAYPQELRESFENQFVNPSFSELLSPLKQTVDELSTKLDKAVQLHLEVPETTVPAQRFSSVMRSLTEDLKSRINANIESPMIRQNSGKPRTATIKILVVPISAGQFKIEVTDDGLGAIKNLIVLF